MSSNCRILRRSLFTLISRKSVAAFVAALALPCGPLATYSQTATLPPPQVGSESSPGQNHPEPSTRKSPSPARAPLPEDVVYSNFITLLALDYHLTQQRIHDAKPGSPPVVLGRKQALAIGASPEQFQFILDTVLTAHARLSANTDQWNAARLAWVAENGRNLAHAAPDPEMIRLAQEETEILQRTIATLKQGLGETTFPSFNRWVHQHYGEGFAAPAANENPQSPAVSQ